MWLSIAYSCCYGHLLAVGKQTLEAAGGGFRATVVDFNHRCELARRR